MTSAKIDETVQLSSLHDNSMKIFILFFVVFGNISAKSAIRFTLHIIDPVNWATAKSRCEARGQRLAVLDTEEKLTALQEQVVLDPKAVSSQAWIGFHDTGDNDTFFWLNGNPLPDNDENWMDNNPQHFDQDCGYIRTTTWELADFQCFYPIYYICECNLDVEENISELLKSGTYKLTEISVGINSDELIYLQVQSKLACAAECLQRNCDGFSFQEQTPDVGMCNMTMTGSATQHPLEGARYYIKS